MEKNKVKKIGPRITFVVVQLSNGGAERVTSILANHFYEQGYRVTVITLEEAPIDYYIHDGIRHICTHIERNSGGLSALKQCGMIRKVLRRSDVWIALGTRPVFFATISSLFLRTTKVLTERSDPSKTPETVLKRMLRNICFLFGNIYVFQTREQRMYFGRTMCKKGIIIPNPVRDDLPLINHNKNNKIIVSACRYEPQKNIKVSIDAFERLYRRYPDFQFHIYGKGSLRQELQEYIDSKGLRKAVYLKDYSTDIDKIFSESMVFLSSADYEGISNSMLEAMAIGVPCVCTDCPIGGARETIKHGYNGFLVPVGDSEKMAYYLIKLAEDEELRRYISRNSLKLRETLDKRIICKKWENVVKIGLKRLKNESM